MKDEQIKSIAESEDLSVKVVNENGKELLYVQDSEGNTVITSVLDHLSESLREKGIETQYDIDDDGIEILHIL